MEAVKKNKDNKQELILKEAAKLFRQKGFGGTSMRDLGQQVGMEAASMYYHIGSKDEILVRICFGVADTYIAHFADIESKGVTYKEKLKEVIRFHVRMMITNGPEVAVTNHDWKYLSDEKLNEFKQLRKDYENNLQELIEKGISAGEFSAIDAHISLYTILSALRWIEFWWKPERGVSPKDLENSIISLLLNGLEKKHEQVS